MDNPDTDPPPRQSSLAQPRLLQLVDALRSHVQSIQEHLTNTSQLDPGFVCTPTRTDYDAVDDTRIAALENLLELQDLLMTPRELLVAQAVRSYLNMFDTDLFVRRKKG